MVRDLINHIESSKTDLKIQIIDLHLLDSSESLLEPIVQDFIGWGWTVEIPLRIGAKVLNFD